MSSELQVGDVLDNRFKIVELIARSGMATIFKAADLQTQQAVAVKVPFMQYESDPAFYSRFQREEEIGKALNHPYILHFVAVENKSRPYLVMELLSGKTLGKALKKEKKMSLKEALPIVTKICEALDYMHKSELKVIHRDLKPDNVMLCDDGTIRLMDFGIAKAGLKKITFVGFSSRMGTPDYMAPEQVKGQRGDERTDIYSLGAMLYEMLTGHVPFEDENPHAAMNSRLVGDPPAPRKMNPDITPEVEEIILHALARKPEDRYASAADMKAEIDNPQNVTVTGRCDRLQPPTQFQKGWQMSRMVILAILVPIIAVVLFFIFMRRG